MAKGFPERGSLNLSSTAKEMLDVWEKELDVRGPTGVPGLQRWEVCSVRVRHLQESECDNTAVAENAHDGITEYP